MIKKQQLSSTGFTLVEILITLTVVGILLGIIFSFSMTTFSQSTVESTRAELLSQSQITMDRVINDIRLSASAEATNQWPDLNNANGDFAWQSDASTLVLATAVVDSANNVIFADASKYISEKNDVIYFVQNGTLYKRVLASTVANNAAKTTCPAAVADASCPADRALLNNVSSFSAKYFDGSDVEVAPTSARSIELNIKTSTAKFKQNITSDYTTRAVFRND